MKATNKIPFNYYKSARWMYQRLNKSEPSKQTELAWGKLLYKISISKNNRDLYLIESLFIYSQFDDKWKKRIDNPNKIDTHFDAIACDACNFIGVNILAEILAMLYVYGGEYTCYNLSFRFYIPLAKWKFNFWGGDIPTIEGVELVNQKIFELERSGDKVEWFANLQESVTKDHWLKSFEPLNERFWSYKTQRENQSVSMRQPEIQGGTEVQ